ncbi:MAG: hypothetical protein KC766_27930 [Myxococcales bacterium]|nr:hypothetical protein [Myxococcales bacterium]
MGLLHQIHALRREVTAPRSQRLYDEHARSEPALRLYGSVEDLLTALEAREEASYRAREDALRALVTLHHASDSTLWASLLLVAFAPMLVRFRGELGAAGGEPDALVFEGFLETLAGLDPSANIPLTLRLGTRRHVLRVLHRDRRAKHQQIQLEEHARQDSDFRLWETRSRETHDDADEAVELLNEFVPEPSEACELELVIATKLRREPLRDYLDRRYGQSATETDGQRRCACFRRRRARALEWLRRVLRPRLEPRLEALAWSLELPQLRQLG